MANTDATLALAGEIVEVKSAIRENRGWFIGLMVGVNLLGSGLSCIVMSSAVGVE